MEASTIFYYFFVAFCSFFALGFYQKKFLKNKLHDEINNRSSHKVIATRSGGISIFSILFIVSTYEYLRGNLIFDFSLIVPLSILVIVGLYDDIYRLDFKLKFIFQIIAAKIIIDNGLVIDNLHGVLGIFELDRISAQILTIFIILALINSINFIDGIDGLATFIVLMFICLFEFFSSGISPFINLTALIIASGLPLIFFNLREKNKVFLGDSGSLFLGGVVSIYVIYILSQNYIIKTEYDIHKILFVISILIFPILDITRIFFLRLLNGKSPFKPDKNHIHHLILNKTKNHLLTTLIIVFLSIFVLIIIQYFF